MLVQDFLERNAERYPEKCALVCGGRRFTYSAIDQMVNRLANAMLAQGLERGGRVAIYLPNSVEAVAAIFAVLKAGGTFLVIHRGVKREKLTRILANCRASGLVTDLDRDAMAELAAGVPSLRFFIGTSAAADPDNRAAAMLSFPGIQEAFPAVRPRPRCIDLDLACLIYTSG